MNNKYLRITIHDNDYTRYWKEFGTIIRNLILPINSPISENDLVYLKKYIQHIWYALDNLYRFTDREGGLQETNMSVFNIDIDIVDASDVTQNNCEDIYITLFETYNENANVLLM